MKNRVKGLLALCLAMCMVLAMTAVAFGAEPYHYSQIPEDGLILQAGAQITTVKGNYSGRSFFVVDGSGNYSTTMNTEANGAHGTAYTNANDTNSAVPYFTDLYFTDASESSHDTFTLPKKAGYEYNVQRVTVNDDAALYSRLQDPNSNSGIPLIATALKVTPVVKDGYTVKYDLDGGSFTTTPPNKTGNVKWTDEVLDGVTNPTKDGFIFNCWMYDSEAVSSGETYGSLARTEKESITLVAQWMPAEQLPSTPSTPNETPNAPSGGDTIHRQNVTADAKADTTKTDTIASPKTFDAGVAVYGAMAIASLLGMGYVGKKRV